MARIPKAKTQLAKSILKWLIDKEMSCADLAESIGVDQALMSRWINGRGALPYKAIERIAELGIPDEIIVEIRRTMFTAPKCRVCPYHPENR